VSRDDYELAQRMREQALYRDRRERIATAAMQGLLAQSQYWPPHKAADEAIEHADALIERLDKEVQP
jgi:hypothetical protein